MSIAAEQLLEQDPSIINISPLPKLVEVVPEMAEDVMVRHRAARFIGACTLNQEIDYRHTDENLVVGPIDSLFEAVKKAAEGDPIARKMVEANAQTDVIERTIKAGHIMEVELLVDSAGVIQQHGQTTTSIQANSLRLASDNWQMRERTEAETTNALRIEQQYRQGKLHDYNFVVFSRAADNMTKQEMKDAGFFTDTMSCAVQVTMAKGDKLSTESAFVAGVRRPGEERHDAQTVIATAAKLGVDLTGLSAAQIINTPMLIHKSLMPNGVIDLVKIYDKCAGTFFGEARAVEDYVDYRRKCEERERQLQPKVDSIVNQLIREAPFLKDPIHAVKRLGKISEQEMVEQAVFDHEINPLVFGPAAAGYIEEARIQFWLGNNANGLSAVYKAKETAASSCCPSALKQSGGLEDLFSEEKIANTDKDIEFVSKECPLCHAKNVKTRVTKTHIVGSCGCSKKI